jgi:ABC-2 type transport system permease protein
LTVWLIIKKNMRIFLADRKGLAISLVLPIALATIMGLAFSGVGKKKGGAKLALAVVDLDRSPSSEKLVSSLEKSPDLAVTRLDAEEAACDAVRRRTYVAALVIRPEAGRRLKEFFFSDKKAEFHLFMDPSRRIEGGMLRGILMEKTMEAVSASLFDGKGSQERMKQGLANLTKNPGQDPVEREKLRSFFESGLTFFDAMPDSGTDGTDGEGPGSRLSRPFTLEVEAVTGAEDKQKANFDMMAQTFAGTGVMFLLFTVLDGALAFVRERQRRTLARLLAAPVSRISILLGECGSYFLVGLGQLVLLFAFAKIVFHIPFHGSFIGFVLVLLATCWAVTGFGLIIAVLGRTEKQVQGFSILVILVMSALGGSMIPFWLMPEFMQTLASVTITKWAIMGFEAVTWRGLGLIDVALPITVLASIGTVLFGLSVRFCRWE